MERNVGVKRDVRPGGGIENGAKTVYGTEEDVQRARDASRAFRFPYEVAYSIQLDLMQAVYDAIEGQKVGVFESPTGTGKSLSLLCAACTWLERNREKQLEDEGAAPSSNGNDDDEPQWVRDHQKDLKQREAKRRRDEMEERIRCAREKVAQRRRERMASGKRQRRTVDREPIGEEDGAGFLNSEDEFLVDDGASRADAFSKADPNDASSFLSPAVRALMEQSGSYLPSGTATRDRRPFFARSQGGGHASGDDDEPETAPKIIFTSRTHSQLTQFIGELKRTTFGGKKETKDDEHRNVDDDVTVRVITLGSRKQMCVNSSVVAVGQRRGVEAMNERCVELMKTKSATDKKSRCKFLPSHDEQGHEQMLEFRDAALSDVHDIEEVVQLGRDTQTCPYFGSRQSVKQAHLVTLPYNLLLNAVARESLGIDLKGSIVIIDEAHNLIDTILQSHSVVISSAQVEKAIEQVKAYEARFAMRLKASNEINLKKFLRILDGMRGFCASVRAQKATEAAKKAMTTGELIQHIGGNVDQVNLMELCQWLRDTKIARKVAGYADKQQAKAVGDRGTGDKTKTELRGEAVSAIHSIESYLLSLSNRNLDGRVYVERAESRASQASTPRSDEPTLVMLKYQLLNPSEVFRDVVDQSRSVILAGGTMAPVSDVQTQLLPYLEPSKFVQFSCSHIIPKQNLMAAVVRKGTKGLPLEFTFEARSNAALLDELVVLLANYANVVPHGMVVFVPSYGFLDSMMEHWRTQGSLTRLSAKKRVFCEPKEATNVDKVLREYGETIERSASADTAKSGGGAILFAVVGAKLSEGINFSDRLARAVVMVGMPFANAKSVELAERMRYVRQQQASMTADNQRDRVDAGQELYVNLCMKAVNQSIGRAIRHRSDYAALIFLDARYARDDIRNRLPEWIRQSTSVYDTFGPSMAALGRFFREKRREV